MSVEASNAPYLVTVMNRPCCSICHAPGTHHVYAEIRLSLTNAPRRISDIVTCARHVDDITHALKMNHIDSPYAYVFAARLEEVAVDDLSPAVA